MSLRVGTTLVNQLKLALIFLILFAYPRLLFDYPKDNHRTIIDDQVEYQRSGTAIRSG
jgi:hypothetical protein